MFTLPIFLIVLLVLAFGVWYAISREAPGPGETPQRPGRWRSAARTLGRLRTTRGSQVKTTENTVEAKSAPAVPREEPAHSSVSSD